MNFGCLNAILSMQRLPETRTLIMKMMQIDVQVDNDYWNKLIQIIFNQFADNADQLFLYALDLIERKDIDQQIYLRFIKKLFSDKDRLDIRKMDIPSFANDHYSRINYAKILSELNLNASEIYQYMKH